MRTPHLPNYRALRFLQAATATAVIAASTWSSFGEPDPHHKLPTMRPEASILLGPQSGQSPKKIENKPKTPAAAKAGPSAKGAKSGKLGSLKAAFAALAKKPTLKTFDDDEEDDEDYGFSAWRPDLQYGYGHTAQKKLKL